MIKSKAEAKGSGSKAAKCIGDRESDRENDQIEKDKIKREIK